MKPTTASSLARGAALALLALALSACSGGRHDAAAPPQPPALESIVVGNGRAYASVGVPLQLTVTGRYSDGSTAPISSRLTWSSSDPAIATVEYTGLVTPWGKGTAVVTVTHATGLSATVELVSRYVVPILKPGYHVEGSVDTGLSYFRVVGLTPGTMYEPAVDGMTDDVDVAVYSDPSMAPEVLVCGSALVGTAAERCVAPANAAGELWLAIDGQWTQAGASFSVDVREAPAMVVSETFLFPELLPYRGSVGRSRVYHAVTGLAPGARYEVRISNLTADIDLAVYGDEYRYDLRCESFLLGTADDVCTATPNAAGELFVEIDGETTFSGGSYTLGVTPG